MARLLVTQQGERDRIIELDDRPVVVGRALDCDLVVMDHMVSRRHARFAPLGEGRWQVVDNDSANGVFVNEQRILKPHVLADGDRLRIGPAQILFRAKAEGTRVTIAPETGGGAALSMVRKVTELRPEFSAPTEHQTMLGLVSSFRKRQAPAGPQAAAAPGTGATDSFHFFVLFQLAQAINAVHALDDLFDHVLDLLVESMSAVCGAILLKDERTGELKPQATRDLKQTGELRVSRTIADKAMQERVAILTRDALADPRFNQGASIAAMQIHSAVCCPIWDGEDVDGIIYLVASDDRIFTEADRDLVSAAGHQLAVGMRQEEMRRRLREEATIRANLARYHSPDVVEIILQGGAAGLEVCEADVTVLFADIEGFTPLSQRLPPAEIARILNGYFAETTQAIFRHRGQVNKYIGDAILAVFGAPIGNPNHAVDACNAALDMIAALHRFRETLPQQDRFRIRIAINSGAVVAGNIGAPQRLEYTVIGNTVNVASRLEKCAPPDGVVIGPATARRVAHAFHLQTLGPQELKGVSQALEVFVISGRR